MKQITVADLIDQLREFSPSTPIVLALAPGELCEAQPVVALDLVAYANGMLYSALGSEMDYDTPKDAIPVVALLPLQNMCHEMRYATLPTWASLSDIDKACVVAYWAKCDSEGVSYARENYSVKFVDSFELANLTTAEACLHADRLLVDLCDDSTDPGEGDAFAVLGPTEWGRLMDIYEALP